MKNKQASETFVGFTEKEIEVIYHALTQEMNQSFKSKIYYDINFEILEHWYLLLKKIKNALEQYEKKTDEYYDNMQNKEGN